MPQPGAVMVLLKAVDSGESDAPEKLLELVYEDLRRLATSYMRNERSSKTHGRILRRTGKTRSTGR